MSSPHRSPTFLLDGKLTLPQETSTHIDENVVNRGIRGEEEYDDGDDDGDDDDEEDMVQFKSFVEVG